MRVVVRLASCFLAFRVLTTRLKSNTLYGGRVVKYVLKKKVLSIQIRFRRKVMYIKAERFGLTHPEVVAYSQALDVLLNRYQGIQ